MQLNLPILDQLKNSQNILIAGAGGGFDVFCGLPVYFTLREMGKSVHLANYSFTELTMTKFVSEPVILINGLLVGAQGTVSEGIPYYPEGYLAQWFMEAYGQEVIVWMIAKMGVVPVHEAYTKLIDYLDIDTLVLIDAGVDALAKGDETGSGTLIEDSISLAAANMVDVPIKLLGCIGFGTEVEEKVRHYLTLENMASLIKQGAFLGSCALTPQMNAFRQFENASRYVWEQPNHPKSHISTRVIPAVRGEFGNYHMYPSVRHETELFVSPLMSLYWFFDLDTVVNNNLIIDVLEDSYTHLDAYNAVSKLEQTFKRRPRQSIPY